MQIDELLEAKGITRLFGERLNDAFKLVSLFLYPIIGAIAGLLAGLFGVGGGAIIVPLLFIFSVQGFPEASIVHLALGTSFATIVITSISSYAPP